MQYQLSATRNIQPRMYFKFSSSSEKGLGLHATLLAGAGRDEAMLNSHTACLPQAGLMSQILCVTSNLPS